MRRLNRASLRPFNTFGVEASAAALVEIESPEDLEKVEFDADTDLVLGGGSNILFAGDVPGTVFLNRMMGRRILEDHDEYVVIEAGGGENWHQLVLWSLDQGLSGLENLSLIPGLVGAAPMQNIGAYGVELVDELESVSCWDWRTGKWRRFNNHDCRFSYRDSRFKSGEPDHYLITSIRLRLEKQFTPRLSYAGIGEELLAMGVSDPTAGQVSDAVIRIRQRKFPDPAKIGNAGSFFKNPVVSGDESEDLRSRFDGLPVHRVSVDTAKLSAAWMIEHCGWKGHRQGDAGISFQHALVLVNHGTATGKELWALACSIRASINEMFGVLLNPEPRIIQT